MKLIDLPEEILLKISDNLNIIDFINFKDTCKYLESIIKIEDQCYSQLNVYETNEQTIEYNDINELVNDKTYEICDDIFRGILTFPTSKHYSTLGKWNDYILSINRNLVLTEGENGSITSEYAYSFKIKKKDVIYNSLYYSNNVAYKRQIHHEPMKIPILLFYIGVKIINEIDGINMCIPMNFNNEIPSWLSKMILKDEYPGYLLKELIDGEIII